MNKVKIELRFLLPRVPDSRDQCVERIGDRLRKHAGIDHAHISIENEDQPDRLCIHFNPDAISVSDVRQRARQEGAKLEDRYGHFVTRIESMHARRASAIESRLERVDGVLEAVVTPDGALRVEYDHETRSRDRIATALREWSQQTEQPRDEHDGHELGGIFGPRSELIFAILCGTFLLIGWLLETFAAVSEWLPWVCFVAAYLFGGYYTVIEAIEKIRAGKFEIDFLISSSIVRTTTLLSDCVLRGRR